MESDSQQKVSQALQKASKSYYNPHNFYLEVGKLIARARKQAGLTQDKLADVLDVSRVTIGNMEKGIQNIPFHTVFKLADILQVPLTSLIPKDLIDFLPKQPVSGFREEDLDKLRAIIQEYDSRQTAKVIE